MHTYGWHLILKELKEPETQVQLQIMNIDKVISNLQSTITSLQGRWQHVKILELAMCLTAVKLCSAMKADEVLLLPEVHQTFQLEVQNCQCLKYNSHQSVVQETVGFYSNYMDILVTFY